MDWWLEHGLDGIAGGVVGGLLTWGAVWLTIRHERSLVRHSEYRGFVVAAHTAAIRLEITLKHGGAMWRDATRDLSVSATELGMLTVGEEMAVDLLMRAKKLREAADILDSQATLELVGELRAGLGTWLRRGQEGYDHRRAWLAARGLGT